MTLNDVATMARQFVRESASSTFSIQRAEAYVIACYFDWCRELQWPEASFNAATATDPSTGVTGQEYQLPENINLIFRVYLNGQRCAETSIPILEGDVQQIYNPNWRILPSVTVPQLSQSLSLQAVPITASPAFAQLQFYVRGGFVGFTPAPAVNGYPILIEGCIIPPVPGDADSLLLPRQWQHGLAYGAVYRFLLSDRRAAEAKIWRDLEQEQWQMAMRWRRRMGGDQQLPVVQPQGYRSWYARGTIGLQLPTSVAASV